ncbi:MAG: PilN domain-containing protein [Omnitrophica bacterium]|nr:PilN domain-containing protein [Candidatus Omnitrophota bacterium]
MIELNLLPEEFRKKKKKFEMPEIPVVSIAVVFIGFLAAIQLLLGGWILMSKRQLVALDAKWEALAPDKAELDSIKKVLLDAGRKTNAIEALIAERLSWARLLNELSNSLSANIWLTELTYRKGPAGPSAGSSAEESLTLSGSAVARGEQATQDIARFIKALKANKNFFKYFDDVELVSIKKGLHTDKGLMNFTLICKFKSNSEKS